MSIELRPANIAAKRNSKFLDCLSSFQSLEVFKIHWLFGNLLYKLISLKWVDHWYGFSYT